MTDSVDIDSLAHDHLLNDDKLHSFLEAFEQDEFSHLATAMLQYCISDYAKLPDSVQTVVFKMAEVMAMKELDVPCDINTIAPF